MGCDGVAVLHVVASSFVFQYKFALIQWDWTMHLQNVVIMGWNTMNLFFCHPFCTKDMTPCSCSPPNPKQMDLLQK